MHNILSSTRYSAVKYACVMGGGDKEEVYPMSFRARIRGAMARKGWDAEAMTLMEQWEEKFGEENTPSRQAFYAWFKADDPKIDHEKLFDLADLLDVNPRWLTLKSDDMARPFTPGMELKEFLDAYDHLGPKGRDALIKEVNREARKLLDVQEEASIAKPYKKATTR